MSTVIHYTKTNDSGCYSYHFLYDPSAVLSSLYYKVSESIFGVYLVGKLEGERLTIYRKTYIGRLVFNIFHSSVEEEIFSIFQYILSSTSYSDETRSYLSDRKHNWNTRQNILPILDLFNTKISHNNEIQHNALAQEIQVDRVVSSKDYAAQVEFNTRDYATQVKVDTKDQGTQSDPIYPIYVSVYPLIHSLQFNALLVNQSFQDNLAMIERHIYSLDMTAIFHILSEIFNHILEYAKEDDQQLIHIFWTDENKVGMYFQLSSVELQDLESYKRNQVLFLWILRSIFNRMNASCIFPKLEKMFSEHLKQQCTRINLDNIDVNNVHFNCIDILNILINLKLNIASSNACDDSKEAFCIGFQSHTADVFTNFYKMYSLYRDYLHEILNHILIKKNDTEILFGHSKEHILQACRANILDTDVIATLRGKLQLPSIHVIPFLQTELKKRICTKKLK